MSLCFEEVNFQLSLQPTKALRFFSRRISSHYRLILKCWEDRHSTLLGVYSGLNPGLNPTRTGNGLRLYHGPYGWRVLTASKHKIYYAIAIACLSIRTTPQSCLFKPGIPHRHHSLVFFLSECADTEHSQKGSFSAFIYNFTTKGRKSWHWLRIFLLNNLLDRSNR